MSTNVNWREGTRRIRIVAWIVWIGAVAIYLPYEQAKSWEYLALQPPYADKQSLEMLRRSQFFFQVRESFASPIYWGVIVLLGVIAPVAAYGLVYILFRVSRWIARGFAITQR